MKILSVNVGKPQKYTFNEATIETSMVKTPQKEIQVNLDSIEGDVFKSKNAHGTIDAVIYALDSRRYPYWSDYLGKTIPVGTLGENLSVDKLDESEFFLGDEFQCGGVVMKVTGVRYPCSRLNFVTGNSNMQLAFRDHDWPGVYFQIVKPGNIRPGDDLVLKKRHQTDISVLELYRSLRDAEKGCLAENQFEKLSANTFVLPRYQRNLARGMAPGRLGQ